jgi:hypothetical protein
LPNFSYESSVNEDADKEDEDSAGVGAPEVGRLVLVMNCSLLLLLETTNANEALHYPLHLILGRFPYASQSILCSLLPSVKVLSNEK